MTAIRHHRKDLRIEARFLPDSIEDAERLRDVIRDAIEAGAIEDLEPRWAEATANGLTGWLIGKRQGVDGLSAPTRSRYRKILTALEEQAGGPGGGQRGAGRLGIAGVLAAASGGAALALAPIIYEDPAETAGGELAAAA